jgi:hypothetical protein
MDVCFQYFAREAAGALSTPRFLRPLFFRGKGYAQLGRTPRREMAEWCLPAVIARSKSDEAIHSFTRREWIASRSLSSGAHSRDPLARNDGATGKGGTPELQPPLTLS